MPRSRTASYRTANCQDAGRQRACLRVYDLRLTYGQRLRDAGVPEKVRSLLMGHAMEETSQHDATATLARLLKTANSMSRTKDRATVLRTVPLQKVAQMQKRVSRP